MKRKLKNSSVMILSFIILILFTLFLSIIVIKEEKITHEENTKLKEECKIILKEDTNNEVCNELLNKKEYKIDTLTTFNRIINHSDYSFIYYLLIPFLIIMSSMYEISYRLKNKDIKNRLTRESYNKYIKKIILSSYKSIILWPIITIFALFISYLISGTLEVTSLSDATFSNYILMYPFRFIISYLINTILMSIFYINIGLLIVPENKNYLVTVIETIMVYYGITLTNTFFVIGFLLKNINGAEKYLDFFDMYTYHNKELIPFNILCFIISLISSILVYIKYKNKEKIIIKIEKN